MVVQEVRSSDLQGRTEFTPKDFHALSDHLTDHFRTLSTNFKIGASNFSPTLGQLSDRMSENFGNFNGMAGDGWRDGRYHTPAHPHTPTHTHTIFSKRPFLVKFAIILFGTQEYFSYLPDEPYARDLQAQGACAPPCNFFKVIGQY